MTVSPCKANIKLQIELRNGLMIFLSVNENLIWCGTEDVVKHSNLFKVFRDRVKHYVIQY